MGFFFTFVQTFTRMSVISNNEIHVKYVVDSSQLQQATQAMSGITAEERKLLADLKKLQEQLNNTGKTGKSAGDDIAGSLGNVGQVVKALIPVFSIAFAVDKLKQFASYAFETAKQFEQMSKTLAFVTGSSEKANQQLSYMTALSQSLGLNVRALTDGFKGFAAAASFAGVSQENINRQMVAFTKAAAALSMSAEDTKLMFSALSQMYSKNKIQAEELRGQLGERLPGAMELLAKSMGLPVSALDELLKKGEIITKEVMPNFAKEVEVAFGIAADQTDTLTAAQNRMFTAIEVAATRIMEGGIGDFIKTLLNSIATISQYLSSLVQDNYQNQVDYNNRLIVEVEKNVLYEVEAYRKAYQEKTGILLSVGEAAKKIREDEKNGEAAYWKWYEGQLKDIEESSKDSLDRIIRGTHKAFGTIGDVALSPLKLMKAMVKDAFAPLTGGTGNEMIDLFSEKWKQRSDAINKNSQAEIEAAKARQDKLLYLEKDGLQKQKEIDDEAADKKAKDLKNRYQRELSILELQEKISKLYAEAQIENEFERSQQILRISANFNVKKKEVDDKYFEQSKNSTSQHGKDLAQLASNNSKLRKAENASLYADIRRNEEEYHRAAYEAAIKALNKNIEQRKKYGEKLDDLEKIENERLIKNGENSLQVKLQRDRTNGKIELQNANQKYNELIDINIANQKKELENEKLTPKAKKEIQQKYYDEIISLIELKYRELGIIRKRNANNETQNLAAIARENYQDAKRDMDDFAKLNKDRLDTSLLAEENTARARKANYRELQQLEERNNLIRIDNDIKTKEKQLILNKQYGEVLTEEEKKQNLIIQSDIERLYAEKDRLALDSRDRRIQYETEIMQAALDASQQIFNDIMNIQTQQFENQIAKMNKASEEQIRLADGNVAKITEIKERQAREEAKIRKKMFVAEQVAATAEVVFKTAPLIAQWSAGVITAPLAIIALAAQAAAITAIWAQPVPEYRKGTRGKKHAGGPAIVGEEGVEKVVTESGRVYYTPPTATLLDLPKGAEVIPNNMLPKSEVYYASMQSSRKKQSDNIGVKIEEIGNILKSLPVHQINMNERGFEKYIRTEKRSTKILNNQFPSKY